MHNHRCKCKVIRIYFHEEMDYDDIREDFKKTLVDHKMDLKSSSFNFPLLMYYLTEMGANIFPESTNDKYKYDTLDKCTTVIASNKLNIMLYDSDIIEKEMSSNNQTNEDYNLLSELVDTQLFQKYIFRKTKYKIRENALRHITDLVINRLKMYMDNHGIKKISIYDKTDRTNMKLITVFIRPSLYLGEYD